MNTFSKKPVMSSGQLLRHMRKSRGMTLAELGEKTGHAGSTISQWETGRRIPTIETFDQLIKALGADIYVGGDTDVE